MALEIFYSALHWAKKAERSATSAANSARTAQTAAAQSEQASGKIIQLGFDGAIEDGKLVFKHAPSGVEVPYELLDDYEYEVDMLYNSAEELSSDLPMVIKNGPDTVTFVSALHRSSTEPATVGDMKAVMRYNSDTGYRWLFKAAYKVTTSGDKVFLLYPVAASEEVVNSKITNCITDIPQDIKLELNNGNLTLKAGSKIYVPNGFEADGVTPKFDVVTVDGDKNIFDITKNEKYFVMYDADKKSVTLASVNDSVSGVGAVPNVGLSSGYDTSTNIIKRYNGDLSVAFNLCSFPLAVTTWVAGSGCVSIDQVFNGFGYVGSTVFALPGVKTLGPNGRNEDGSLRNIENNVTSVITRDFKAFNGDFSLYIINGGFAAPVKSYIIYDAEKNYNKQINDGTYFNSAIVLDFSKKPNENISSFSPKTTFHAVDRSDSSWVSAQAMPSGKYINLTLGASGSTYTAPANGYVYFDKAVGATDVKYMTVINVTKGIVHRVWATGSQATNAYTAFCPVNKGDVVRVDYNFTGATNAFRFVYAEGEN